MMQITWDPEKERRNLRKHGLDFSFAAAVFLDPLAVTVFDRAVGAEDRWHTVGAVAGGPVFKILLVVHAYPDPDDDRWIRIISLRAASTRERRHYENLGD